MKVLIIEGIDNVGKNSVITSICEHYEYDNVTIRHCGKPPKDVEIPFSFQTHAFSNEFKIMDKLLDSEKNENYYENRIIYNRFYLGEYVYGQMYRNVTPEKILSFIDFFEQRMLQFFDPYLITLYSTPEFAVKVEDGCSISEKIEDKTKEIELFKTIHNHSAINNKLLLKIDNLGEWKSKEEINSTILNFINKK
jgi:thymidylate kinase